MWVHIDLKRRLACCVTAIKSPQQSGPSERMELMHPSLNRTILHSISAEKVQICRRVRRGIDDDKLRATCQLVVHVVRGRPPKSAGRCLLEGIGFRAVRTIKVLGVSVEWSEREPKPLSSGQKICSRPDSRHTSPTDIVLHVP